MSAIISPCGQYRTRLDRVLDDRGGPTIGFMLHNPSTADANLDDPTSKRGMGFAAREGGSRMIFMNPWAGRATKPADLWRMADPVGPDNDRHIAAALAEIKTSGGFIIAAWGRVSPPVALRPAVRDRLNAVERMIRDAGLWLFCLGTNADGSPKHPLYLAADTPLVPWPRIAREAVR